MASIIKLKSALNLKWSFSYLRTQADLEIDLIIEKSKGLPILIEIKSISKIEQEKIKSFSRLAKDIKHSQAYYLSNSKEEYEIDGIRCLHWQKGLKEIFNI